MAARLRGFWIKTAGPNDPSPRGYGVTAYDDRDALAILAFVAFQGVAPAVTELISDVDIQGLDSGHILPNMNPPNLRGVWYPTSYDTGPVNGRDL